MLLRQLSYFIAVAEHCGFSRAAAALHVSQPALSQQIRQLEAMLEVQLFDRSGRRIRLTDAGEIWLEYARRALRELEEGRRALHDAEDLQHGKLRIAMTPTFTTYMLGPLMEAYYRRYPGVKVLIQEMNQERMEAMLLEDELDVGIAFDDSRSQEIVVSAAADGNACAGGEPCASAGRRARLATAGSRRPAANFTEQRVCYPRAD